MRIETMFIVDLFGNNESSKTVLANQNLWTHGENVPSHQVWSPFLLHDCLVYCLRDVR
jgi:hypothetical protein